ncbi:hypothetical protein ZWY2020_013746 [Hordeum vulgare]|nr:hypothetical protein ZWY2020_013746 [Hordeum vulgare]
MELSDSELAGVKSYREYIELTEKKEEQLRKDCEIKDKGTYGEQEIEEHSESSRSFYSSRSPSRVDAVLQNTLPRRSCSSSPSNYLFRCTKDSCQTLTQKDPFLRLTGPSCAIWLLGRVSVDVQLKVKCKKESEDEVLAYKFYEFFQDFPFQRVLQVPIRCNRCTLEFNVTVLPSSVEATVGVRVVDGSWPDQCRGLVVCNTDSVKGGKVVLLDSQDGKLPTKSDGVVELVRRVVSVDEPKGKLIISVEASRDGFPQKNSACTWYPNRCVSSYICSVEVALV